MADKKFNDNGHEYVDLELPSRTLWATCNVGASKFTDYGLYFQWGDTKGYTPDQIGEDKEQKEFIWTDYKWYNKSTHSFDNSLVKYATLKLENDAARSNMGGDWHLPGREHIKELLRNTTNEWAVINGINGRLFTSKKNKSKFIFFPFSGSILNGKYVNNGRDGGIWTSSLNTNLFTDCFILYFGEHNFSIELTDSYRFSGFAVRGVIG